MCNKYKNDEVFLKLLVEIQKSSSKQRKNPVE